MKPFAPIAVAPIGKRTASGFVTTTTGCGPRTWQEDVFPPSPNGRKLRDLRVSKLRGLSEVARLAGLRPVQLSALEFGRATLTDSEWERLIAMVEGMPKKGGDNG